MKKELELWFPKLKIGGVFSGHDYLDKGIRFGVKSAVDEFCAEHHIAVNVTGEQKRFNESWYFTKRGN